MAAGPGPYLTAAMITKVSETEMVDVAPGILTVKDPLMSVRSASETQPKSIVWDDAAPTECKTTALPMQTTAAT